MRAAVRALAIAATLAAGAVSRADDPARRSFDPDLFRPALGVDRDIGVETAASAPSGSGRATAFLDYASGLLAVTDGGTRTQLLTSRLSLHLIGAYALGPVEVGADLPVNLYQGSNLDPLTRAGVTGPLVNSVAATTLGDVRLLGKLPLLAEPAFPLGLAAALDLRLPTGDASAFTSDGLMVVPSAVVTRTLGRVRLDGQVGYAIRRPGQYLQLVVHDGLTYGAAASVELPPTWKLRQWRAIAELSGGWPRGDGISTDRYRAPLSARAAIRARLPLGLAVELGGGSGIGAAGYGRESWRVFAGVSWDRPAADRDRAPDEVCPGMPGVTDPRACPDADTDGDGVLNRFDLCPFEPGSPETDGCPDTDHDGIPDREDKCPTEPGPPQNDGCPYKEDVPVVEIETERLELRDAIQFDTGRDTLKGGSFRVIDVIAKVLAEHPEIQRIQVEGHTDNVGAAAYNKELSQRRAQTVVSYLVKKGIAMDRLVPMGYGFERPVASNATAGGRAKNRRVEFTILDRAHGPEIGRK
jgi:outer membrane protein OmpA-like peptidoglycan-associated protein